MLVFFPVSPSFSDAVEIYSKIKGILVHRKLPNNHRPFVPLYLLIHISSCLRVTCTYQQQKGTYRPAGEQQASLVRSIPVVLNNHRCYNPELIN